MICGTPAKASTAKAATAAGSDHGPDAACSHACTVTASFNPNSGAPSTKTRPTPPNSRNEMSRVRHAWASMFDRTWKRRRITPPEVAENAWGVKPRLGEDRIRGLGCNLFGEPAPAGA